MLYHWSVTLVSIYPDMLRAVPHPPTGTDKIYTSSDPTTLFIDLTREDSLKIESNFATSMGDTYIPHPSTLLFHLSHQGAVRACEFGGI